MLDTSVVVTFFREAAKGRGGPVTERLGATPDEEIGLPLFVLCELEAGAARARDPERERARVRALASHCEVLYPDERFAARFGDVVGSLRAAGKPPPAMDVLIGVTALLVGGVLLTHDQKGFAAIPGLRLEYL